MDRGIRSSTIGSMTMTVHEAGFAVVDPTAHAGEPALSKTIFVGGLKRLPVRYELRA